MLPKIDYPVYSCELPIDNQTVKFRPFNLNEEKLLLTAKEETPLAFLTQIDNVVKNCLISDIEIKYLVDFIYLFNHIRAKSKGEKVEGTITCEHCKKPTPVSIDLLDSLKILNQSNKKKLVQISDNLGFEIVPIKKAIIHENIDINNEIDIAKYSILYSINKVIYNEKIYDEFTIDELQSNIIDNLTTNQLEKVLTVIADMPALVFKYEIKCINCGNVMKYEESDFGAFFTL